MPPSDSDEEEEGEDGEGQGEDGKEEDEEEILPNGYDAADTRPRSWPDTAHDIAQPKKAEEPLDEKQMAADMAR
eukprot:scaffold432_cov345-Prasinococcus_capsulatus_cf.AAC.3